MRFRRKRKTEVELSAPGEQAEGPQIQLQAQKYGIQFDISPEVSYLNDQLCRLLPEFFAVCEGFPEGVWISQQAVDEGLDFCKVSFWAFSEEPDAIKRFSIWFEAFLRDERVIDLLERFIKYSLDDPDEIEVVLVDWARSHVTANEVQKIVKQELEAATAS